MEFVILIIFIDIRMGVCMSNKRAPVKVIRITNHRSILLSVITFVFGIIFMIIGFFLHHYEISLDKKMIWDWLTLPLAVIIAGLFLVIISRFAEISFRHYVSNEKYSPLGEEFDEYD